MVKIGVAFRIQFFKLSALKRCIKKNNVTGAKVNKKDGFTSIFSITKRLIMTISMLLKFTLGSNKMSCFQKSNMAKGKRKIVVELCQTIGTNLPKYIFFKTNKENGSGMAKQKKRAEAITTICFEKVVDTLGFIALQKCIINCFEIIYFPVQAADKTKTALAKSNLPLLKTANKFTM